MSHPVLSNFSEEKKKAFYFMWSSISIPNTIFEYLFSSLSGLNPGGNLSGLDLSPMMGGMKDTGQQSRFKWMMEGHSPAPSPPDTNLHKNGRLAGGL